ncbi:MAG: tetratricopeptide repeat protein [Acidobacteria bacterium]|nr:tetratricopeptide repeat protein [Acidobacteriota bacterium]MCA1638755.1 tetratricopeptide repeat protein [Acidobacteriota bacterium]
MRKSKNKTALFVFLMCAALLANACGGVQSATSNPAGIAVPPAAPISPDENITVKTIRFLEDKVKRDPEDFSANNKLAGQYLQRLRETGDFQYLDLTFRAARASLASVPEVRNPGGLAALAQAEFAAHDFANARDHAVRLTEIEPGKSYPQGMLGDALLELGEYDKAKATFYKIAKLDGAVSHYSETRMARLAQLRGDNTEAQKHFANALVFALNQTAPPRETVAWLRWQLGETAFSVGDYETAEKHYLDTLVTFPDYYRAIASLGRVCAALGDSPGAIEQYEKVVRILPDPTYIAALGDLYKLAGREGDAKKQYELVEQIGRLSELNGELYNRQLALFYADHDIKLEEAYRLAAKEYEARKDIYGADALAWTALKAGKLNEAKAAIKDALRLNTEDAKLFYHAGMIARAGGDEAAARQFLQRAFKLNPQFDPLQSAIAKTLLENR